MSFVAGASNSLKILICDDDAFYQDFIRVTARSLGYTTELARSYEETMQKVEEAEQQGQPFQVATIDMDFERGDGRGMVLAYGTQIVKDLKARSDRIACIMITGSTKFTPETVLDMRDDYDLDFYIQKDNLNHDTFKSAVEKSLRRVNKSVQVGSQGQAVARGKQPKVFLSYRRSTTWGVAVAIANSLRERGADVFRDAEAINAGRFEDIIKQAIEQHEYFMPILGPNTLESDWVRKEIIHALAYRRKIIPLVVDGFDFYTAKIPPELDGLSSYNGVNITSETYDGMMNNLATRFLGL